MTLTDTATLDAPSSNSNAAETLTTLLADIFALYVKTKNFHWHMSGAHFRDYHLLLDDQATQIFAITDEIAERVRKTGQTTLRSIGDIARRQRIADSDSAHLSAHAMLAMLRDDNIALGRSLREVKTIVDEAGDNATSALVDNWADQAQQRAWFLSEATS